MNYNNSMPMPGAFNLSQHRDQGSRPRISGAHSHIFRPPKARADSISSSIYSRSPSAMSLSPALGRPSISGNRKRSRTEAELPRAPEEDHGWGSMMVNSAEATGAEVCPGSPPPLAHTRYVLAGGMDTPTMKAAQLALPGNGDYMDAGYRRSLGREEKRMLGTPQYSDLDDSTYLQADGLGRDANGRGRGWISPGNGGWGRTAAQVVGGVVEKVWEFCKYGGAAFRGFHAGGGKGYTVHQAGPVLTYEPDESNFWQQNEKSTWGPPDCGTPLPGQFPDESPNFGYSRPERDDPPAKRRQVSRSNTQDELAKNWVVVAPQIDRAARSNPPLRSQPSYTLPTASSTTRRPLTSSGRPASRAGFTAARRPLVTRVSHAGSPALTPNRGASFASPRSSPGSKIPRPTSTSMTPSKARKGFDSPAAKEAQRWAALRKKEERDADESIRRLDEQLKAMIREGKEALGTKIEVEMEDDVDLSG
ncbi:hypothetical protein HYALB_00007361 [Hymenoscyphus albidus]|uniref:Uncharacterized protein n=1 Tax=Hymenoscyphus albidus TaxID=595503 RepID=A0A9N9LHM5_9HELO|nr:hypothetical protein HYALB_00007361 [Hymenoscyphus albidus]